MLHRGSPCPPTEAQLTSLHQLTAEAYETIAAIYVREREATNAAEARVREVQTGAACETPAVLKSTSAVVEASQQRAHPMQEEREGSETSSTQTDDHHVVTAYQQPVILELRAAERGAHNEMDDFLEVLNRAVLCVSPNGGWPYLSMDRTA